MNEQFLETLTQVAPRIFDEMDASLAAFNKDTYKTSFEIFLNKYVDLFSLVEKLTEEELAFIGQFACTAASISTTQSGGIPSIPEEAAVLDRM